MSKMSTSEKDTQESHRRKNALPAGLPAKPHPPGDRMPYRLRRDRLTGIDSPGADQLQFAGIGPSRAVCNHL